MNLATATFAVAARFVTGYPTVDYGAGAADSGFDADRLDRAVAGAGAAFNTTVAVDDAGFFIFDHKHRMRADRGAHATPDTGRLVILQGDNVFEVFQFSDFLIS